MSKESPRSILAAERKQRVESAARMIIQTTKELGDDIVPLGRWQEEGPRFAEEVIAISGVRPTTPGQIMAYDRTLRLILAEEIDMLQASDNS